MLKMNNLPVNCVIKPWLKLTLLSERRNVFKPYNVNRNYCQIKLNNKSQTIRLQYLLQVHYKD